jgi:hypothetical protein
MLHKLLTTLSYAYSLNFESNNNFYCRVMKYELSSKDSIKFFRDKNQNKTKDKNSSFTKP